MLRPHHLLYSITGFYWVKLCHVFQPNAEIIFLLKLMNAFCASVAAFILFKLLRLANIDTLQTTIYTITAGLSWGFLRFSIENETYTIPVMLTVSANYLFLKAESSPKTSNIFFSGFLVASACLSHQIMIFWWIALAIATIRELKFKNYKPLLFFAPMVIVPTAYIIAMQSVGIDINIANFFRFILSDYYTGNATIELNSIVLMVGIINLFRAFFQVHGYIHFIIKQSWLWWTPFLVSGLALIMYFKNLFNQIKPIRLERFQMIHLWALIMQVGFAFVAGGNAEFMAMVRFLAIVAVSGIQANYSTTLWSAISVTVWNVRFGILPQKFFPADSSDLVLKSIEKYPAEKKAYILTDAPKVINRLEYQKVKKPLIVKEASIEPKKFHATLDSLLLQGYTI